VTQLAVAEGSTILRDPVRSADVGDSVYLPAWSSETVGVWLLTDALTAVPQDAGGSSLNFRSVTQDDVGMIIVDVSPDVELVRSAGRAYIVGAEGVVIRGLTDDATLRADGYTTDAEILAARASITAGRVIVSVPVDDAPVNHTYTATYRVGVDARVYDMDPGPAEYLTLNADGGLTITYDEDR
jgi:hypothetical protein